MSLSGCSVLWGGEGGGILSNVLTFSGSPRSVLALKSFYEGAIKVVPLE